MDYATLIVIFNVDKGVYEAYFNGKRIFSQVSWLVVAHYIDDMKSMGWEVVNVSPTASGEIYTFKRGIG